jgi:glycine dehydrogenase
VDADTVGIACSELTTVAHLGSVWAAFGVAADARRASMRRRRTPCRSGCCRTSDYLTHPVFHEHRSETSLMRWLRRLADADLAWTAR